MRSSLSLSLHPVALSEVGRGSLSLARRALRCGATPSLGPVSGGHQLRTARLGGQLRGGRAAARTPAQKRGLKWSVAPQHERHKAVHVALIVVSSLVLGALRPATHHGQRAGHERRLSTRCSYSCLDRVTCVRLEPPLDRLQNQRASALPPIALCRQDQNSPNSEPGDHAFRLKAAFLTRSGVDPQS